MNDDRRPTLRHSSGQATDDRRPTTDDWTSSFILRPSSVAVIGYGSDLRGDDAIGPRVAELLAARDLPDVHALSAPQLTPEQAELLAQARLALFVDAYPADPAAYSGDPPILIRPLTRAQTDRAPAHTSDPSALLALALALYGRAPPAWQVAVPAITFDLGAPLSATAEQGIVTALVRIVELVRQASREQQAVSNEI